MHTYSKVSLSAKCYDKCWVYVTQFIDTLVLHLSQESYYGEYDVELCDILVMTPQGHPLTVETAQRLPNQSGIHFSKHHISPPAHGSKSDTTSKVCYLRKTLM
jgi:hypothetical protein